MAVATAYEIELLTTQFNSMLVPILQQMESRFRPCVQSAAHVGKLAVPLQYITPLQFKQAGARGTPLQPQIANYQRRWVTPADKDLPVQVDSFDELRTIIDPRSALTQSIMAAAGRLFDDLIIAAFFGTAQTGVDGSSLTTETFNSGSNFPVSVDIADTFGASAATGLTVKKIVEALRILQKYENNMNGEIFMAVTSQQVADLRNQLEFVSTEFRNSAMYDQKGLMSQFMGINLVYSERLGVASSDRQVPVWFRDGMHLGIWRDVNLRVTERNDLSGHPWQVYATVTANATRLQGGKVVRINCAGGDTTGAITV